MGSCVVKKEVITVKPISSNVTTLALNKKQETTDINSNPNTNTNHQPKTDSSKNMKNTIDNKDNDDNNISEKGNNDSHKQSSKFRNKEDHNSDKVDKDSHVHNDKLETKDNDYKDSPMRENEKSNSSKKEKPERKGKQISFKISKTKLGNEKTDNLKNLKDYIKQSQDINLISNSFKKHFFLRSLDKQARNKIIEGMKINTLEKDEILFEQLSMGTNFYVVKEGTLSFFMNDQLKKTFVRGDSFGELALLHSGPRSGSVVAQSNCAVFCLDRKDFKLIIDSINNAEFSENKIFINSIPLLSKFD